MEFKFKEHDWSKVTAIVAAITAIVSVVISTVSLINTNERSLEQIELTREHNKLSVKPIITTFFRLNPNIEKIGLGFENRGFGPAKIKEIKYSIDGEWVEGETPLMTQRLVAKKLNITPGLIGFGGLKSGSIFRSEEEKWLFFSTRPGSHEKSYNEIKSLSKHIGIYVCYCSFYEECSTISDGKVPKVLPVCSN